MGPVGRAVELVRAGLGGLIDDAGGGAPVLGGDAIGLNRHFLDGIAGEGDDGARIAGAGDVGAVHEDGAAAGASAADGDGAAGGDGLGVDAGHFALDAAVVLGVGPGSQV